MLTIIKKIGIYIYLLHYLLIETAAVQESTQETPYYLLYGRYPIMSSNEILLAQARSQLSNLLHSFSSSTSKLKSKLLSLTKNK